MNYKNRKKIKTRKIKSAKRKSITVSKPLRAARIKNKKSASFPVSISDYDLYLLNEGSHYRSYEKMGAHPVVIKGEKGVLFTVWAPNAKSVSVVGDFNKWNAEKHLMSQIPFSGMWVIFIPKLRDGALYKFAIRSKETDAVLFKTDPYAFETELRPKTAAVVSSLAKYKWNDREWLEERNNKKTQTSPISIYEVHLGSWKRDGENGWGFLNYRDLARQLVEYVQYMGYTHIELMPVMEYPLDESWGYQVINYYAPTKRYGSPEDLMYFVDYCHQHGIGVILDWVPAHFPRDGHGLFDFDGTPIYSSPNWRRAEQKEWGTLVFDFGRREVDNFLISNALFWLDKYHVDGLRVDAVSCMLYLNYSRKDGEWEANKYGGRENLEAIEFLKRLNRVVHAKYPGVLTIAEESTAWPAVSKPVHLGGLGFSMKWNMGWMHDTIEYFSKDPIYRKWHQDVFPFSAGYAFSENYILPISHDELVYGKRSLLEKMPGSDWRKFSGSRLFLSYMFAFPGKKLLFMGTDFAQRNEWNYAQSLDWHLTKSPAHHLISEFVRDLNRIYRANPALYETDDSPELFEWIDHSDSAHSVISFLRWSRDRKSVLIFVFNMTPVVLRNYRVGVPRWGYYKEILNSQGNEYGGCGIGNLGGVHAESTAWQYRPFSMNISIPPLGALMFRWGK